MELCNHPFWGASPPALQPLPEDPVLQRLLEEEEGTKGPGDGPIASMARHRTSGSGSSLGSDAEYAANGITEAGLRDTGQSCKSASSGGGSSGLVGSAPSSAGSSGDYMRGGGGLSEGGSQLRAADASGDYSASTAVAQQAAAAASAATAATAAAAGAAAGERPAATSPHSPAQDPGHTPAHPRAVARTAGMRVSGTGGSAVVADALAAAGAAGFGASAPQFAAHGQQQQPLAAQQHRTQLQQQQQQSGNSGDGRNGHQAGGLALWAGLDALVYHPTDSVMKPIVGNKRCACCPPVSEQHLMLQPCPLQRSCFSLFCRIERALESMFNPSLLPFQPLVC